MHILFETIDIYLKKIVVKKYDVVLLTDSRYVNPKEIDPYIENVLKEDGLVEEALKKLGLQTIKKIGTIHILIGAQLNLLYLEQPGTILTITPFLKIGFKTSKTNAFF